MVTRFTCRSVLVTALALMLTACTRLPTGAGVAPAPPAPGVLPIGSVVDGHRIGPLMECAAGCDDALSFAKSSAISTRGLDPTAITDVQVYMPFISEGGAASGGGYVVVYNIQGGSLIAIRVHCGVGDCQVVKPQPIDVVPPVDYSCKGSECIRCEGSVCTPWAPPSVEADPTPIATSEAAG